jgi:hypothetical protein
MRFEDGCFPESRLENGFLSVQLTRTRTGRTLSFSRAQRLRLVVLHSTAPPVSSAALSPAAVTKVKFLVAPPESTHRSAPVAIVLFAHRLCERVCTSRTPAIYAVGLPYDWYGSGAGSLQYWSHPGRPLRLFAIAPLLLVALLAVPCDCSPQRVAAILVLRLFATAGRCNTGRTLAAPATVRHGTMLLVALLAVPCDCSPRRLLLVAPLAALCDCSPRNRATGRRLAGSP